MTCHCIGIVPSDQKLVKMTERFSRGGRANFIKLVVKLVKLFPRDRSVLEF